MIEEYLLQVGSFKTKKTEKLVHRFTFSYGKSNPTYNTGHT